MGADQRTVTRVRRMTTDLTNLPQRFQGKVALITGAGSGIGRAVAQRLAAEGASVFAHDINGEALEETAQLVRDAGGTIATRVGSIAERDECFATVAAAVAEFGKLDVLGNVAGISRAQHFTEIDEESYRRLFAVNVDGPFFLCQAAVPHLLESSGNIVNIASLHPTSIAHSPTPKMEHSTTLSSTSSAGGARLEPNLYNNDIWRTYLEESLGQLIGTHPLGETSGRLEEAWRDIL